MSDPTVFVLMIDDDPVDIRIVEQLLKESGNTSLDIQSVSTLADGRKRLSEGNVDVVLLDLNLPDSRGLNTFLDMHEAYPEIPIVVLSGDFDQDLARDIVRQGAQDYLPKNPTIEVDHLLRAVHHAVERGHRNAEEEQDRHQEHLRDLRDFSATTSQASVKYLDNVNEYADHVLDFVTGKDDDPITTATELADRFTKKRLRGKEVVRVHLAALENLTQGMGATEIRPVRARANNLLLAVLSNIADNYLKKIKDSETDGG